MSWEERARKLDAKRRRMPKHGMSVFLMDAAERKRAARRKAEQDREKAGVTRRANTARARRRS